MPVVGSTNASTDAETNKGASGHIYQIGTVCVLRKTKIGKDAKYWMQGKRDKDNPQIAGRFIVQETTTPIIQKPSTNHHTPYTLFAIPTQKTNIAD